MVDAMTKVANMDVELSVEERNLLSVAYKNVVGARRASWRILSSLEQKEESKGNDLNVKRIKNYRHEIESELSRVCADIIALIDEHLIPSCSVGESPVFFYKMKGDYYRYLAEFRADEERKETADLSMKAYQAASTTAEAELPPTHPIRLGLALNFSVFYYEIMNSPERACAKTYSILMRGWGDIGDSNEARKLFDEMLERGCKVDVLAYTSLLEALCKAGNVDEAYKIFREMGSNGVDADASTYSIFIRAYCEANDMHSAFRVLDRMRRYELLPNVYTYNCIIKKLCKNDRVDEAYQLLDEMIERGVWPDTWSYNAMQAYHCDHSEVNRALKLISRMEKDNCMPDRHTYNMVLKLLIRIGRFDRATEVWESMGERRFYPSVSTYAVMIHGLCKKKGKLEEACKYFEMMVDEGIPPYTSTIELLRNRILELGFLDQIEILANKMERSTSCSIQELANMIRGDKTNKTSRSEETDLESD